MLLSLVGSHSYFLYFHFYGTEKYFYFYATTMNVLMGFMPRAYSHGAYLFLTFLFSFQDSMNLIN